jgi:hypothetical protein
MTTTPYLETVAALYPVTNPDDDLELLEAGIEADRLLDALLEAGDYAEVADRRHRLSRVPALLVDDPELGTPAGALLAETRALRLRHTCPIPPLRPLTPPRALEHALAALRRARGRLKALRRP